MNILRLSTNKELPRRVFRPIKKGVDLWSIVKTKYLCSNNCY